LVTGTRTGKQERVEFSSREEALAFLEKRNSQLRGRPVEQAPVVTRLSSNEVKDAELARAMLSEFEPTTRLTRAVEYFRAMSPVVSESEAAAAAAAMTEVRDKFGDAKWTDVCRFYSIHYKPERSKKALVEAIEVYLKDVYRRFENDGLSSWQRDSIGYAMQRLEFYFTKDGADPGFLLSDITTGALNEYLTIVLRARIRKRTAGKKSQEKRTSEDSYSNKSWNNNRGYLTAFFRFCQKRGWIVENPATELENHRRRALRKSQNPEILRATEAAALMQYVEEHHEARLVPFVALALFAGIRPTWPDGEIARIETEDFIWEANVIRLEGVDTKTGRPREVAISDNLRAWLTAYPIKDFPIIPPNFRKLYLALRKRFDLGYDVLRHTYCSMLVGVDNSVAKAALQAGNSEAVLWASYLHLVQREEAAEFWKIMPRSSAAARGMLVPRPRPQSRPRAVEDYSRMAELVKKRVRELKRAGGPVSITTVWDRIKVLHAKEVSGEGAGDASSGSRPSTPNYATSR
jgi:integrase